MPPLQVEQAGLVRRTAEQLEKVGGRVTLDWIARGSSHATLDLLGGTWRLVYSSAFENGNLGGSRPGPPAGLVPFSLVRGSAATSLHSEKVK